MWMIAYLDYSYVEFSSNLHLWSAEEVRVLLRMLLFLRLLNSISVNIPLRSILQAFEMGYFASISPQLINKCFSKREICPFIFLSPF